MKGLCLQILGFCSLLLINPIKCRVINKRSDIRIVPAPSEVPTLPPRWQGGCFYNGTWYPLDSEISSEKYEDGSCSGLRCDAPGNVLSWDNPYCGHSTPSPAALMTTPPPHPGCFHEGKWYDPNTEISRGYDGDGWCYGTYCSDDGHIIPWDDFNCQPTDETTTPTTTPAPPTTVPETTVPPGCLYEGTWYPPHTEISRGDDGHGWCYGTLCDGDGGIMSWDDWNCHSTTPPVTTEETTTLPMTTPTTFPDTSSDLGIVPAPSEVPTLSPNEAPTTTRITTPAPPPTTEMTSPPGCYYEGTWYPPGVINRGYDGDGCGGIYCESDGGLTVFDGRNCFHPPVTTEESTTLPTNFPDTTFPTPIPQGCFYDGKWYLPNTEISRGGDGDGWCYGTYCDDDGAIVTWDNWNCHSTKATEQTTTETTTATTMATEEVTTTPPLTNLPDTTSHVAMATSDTQDGCFHNGNWYPPNSQISFTTTSLLCFGFLCDDTGNIKPKMCLNCKGNSLDCTY